MYRAATVLATPGGMPDTKENRKVDMPSRTPGQAEGGRDLEKPTRPRDLGEPGKTPGSAEGGGLE